MAWLWSFMSPEISDTCMFLPIAIEIQDSIRQAYSKVKDAAQIYELKVNIADAKQGNKTVAEYANLLKILWQEMDHYHVIEMKNSGDGTVLAFIE